jgi:hypothetical protein
MNKKNGIVKIMAFLALFWIIIWIIGTWILVLLGWWNTSTEQTLTPEEYLELQELMNSQSGNTLEEVSWSAQTWSIK